VAQKKMITTRPCAIKQEITMNIRHLKWTMVLMSVSLTHSAGAETWPSKPVRVVTAFSAGSGSDQFARIIAAEFQNVFKQAFIVDPKPGAAGFIAAEFVAKAPADGYTIMVTASSIQAANPHQFKKLPYDPLKDFTPVGLICTVPHVLVVDANLPIKSVTDLIAYGRSAKKFNFAYGNTTGQIGGASFSVLTKMNALGIPYKSTPQALTDIVGGQAGFMVVDLASSQALIKAGKIRTIAVATDQRSALAPDLPTVASTANIGSFDVTGWSAMVAPAGLPPEILNRLNTELNRALARKDVADKILAAGCEVAPTTPAKLGQFMVQQLDSFGKKFKDAGIEPE
jgi:tripartite-type tricarboxylate transporter receptor subunit TctC